MAANEAPVLVSRNVWKRYALGALQVEALKGVSITVMREEFLALAGSSGSGKTTLLNLFGCLDLPTEGEILVEGTDTRTLDEDQAAHFRSAKIGFIFQTFNLIPVLTALENVEYPLLIQGRAPGGRSTSKERVERARAALTKVGLEKVAHHRPDQLSGGQRQRVAIARALVKDPTIILADEPTANLDKRTAIEILDLMRELNEKERVTFVFSSHDSLLLSRAKRICYISDGKEVSAAESGAHHHD